ncbi:HMG box-containing protein [Sphaceloma murrayae]|uniref:HMG box-containing protein n=1 Tax=Sphaceloma murrayae TaxID=2082308 RepID=A0A2K1R451_9PEZI|nr:HMG box-containing protein [Sphaceloma murrayae]
MARKNIDTGEAEVKSAWTAPDLARDGSARVPKSDLSNLQSTPIPRGQKKTVPRAGKDLVDTETMKIDIEEIPVRQENSRKPATGRKVRLLPSVNSLATRTGHFPTFSPSSTPQHVPKQSLPKARATPARSARKPTSYRDAQVVDLDTSEESEFEESIWCDDESEGSDFESDASIESQLTWPAEKTKSLSQARKCVQQGRTGKQVNKLDRPGSSHMMPDLQALAIFDDVSSDKENANEARHSKPPARPLTPPRKTITPPASPSKSRLNSPSKQRIRIPTPPGRPSLDNFWDPHEVNDWNDQHSPKKTLPSPSKHRFLYPSIFANPEQHRFTSSYPLTDPKTPSGRKSPTKLREEAPESPKKSPSKSPSKKSEMEARRAFDERKEALAREFVAELDQVICQGRISAAARSTGGIKIVWSKTLNKTAGRAHWKRQRITSPAVPTDMSASAQSFSSSTTSTSSPLASSSSSSSSPPSSSSPSSSSSTTVLPLPLPLPHPAPQTQQYSHTLSIELASKILTTESRLLNTLAHEFCHLATYVVSEVRDRPHGAEFKSWGRLCERRFGARGVKVTTKHNYEIEFRYLWVCAGRDRTSGDVRDGAKGREVQELGEEEEEEEEEGHMSFDGGCGREYGRHSRSVDPARQRCGVCKGRLVQVRPVPRGKGEVGGFAGFVKSEFAGVKREMEGRGHGEIMAELGRRWRAMKDDGGKRGGGGRGAGEEGG